MRLPKRYHWYRAVRLIIQAFTCVLFGVHKWEPTWYSDEELAEAPDYSYAECMRCQAQRLLKGAHKGEVYLRRGDAFSIIPPERDN